MDVNTPTIDDSIKHLTVEAITSYINYFDQLSLFEVEHADNHISKCSECQKKYNEIFDRLLDESYNIHSLSLFNNSLSDSAPNEVSFEDISNNFRMTIYKNNNDDYILIFNLIPHSVHNNMIRIVINELHLTFRFLNIDVRKEYKIDLPVDTLVDSISEIAVDILITTSRTTFPKKSERRFNFVSMIALLFISIVFISSLFYFFNNKKSNNDEVFLMTHTRKEMLDTDGNRRHQREDESGQQQSNNVESTNDSTSAVDSVFNTRPEDVKVKNEFSRNYILERNVDIVDTTGKGIAIISPNLDDTLHNSIRLRWMDAGKNIAYGISIVDNKNHIMYKNTIRGNDLIYSGKLKPGLYYWNIFVDNQLKQTGKFLVE